MEYQKEYIRYISKFIHGLISLVLVVTITFALMQTFAFIWITLDMPLETVVVHERPVEVPYLLRIGDINIFTPIVREFGFGFSLRTVLWAIPPIIALAFAKNVFKKLKKGHTPFTKEVVRGFNYFAIAFIVVAVNTNVITVVFASIVFAMSFIFDYGRSLQDESDTIL
ncbi:MAG: hypothetical protein FWE24_03245 [Defluviitaleaceae bacterium]|nr:hypothetical protein [Defluviitaleaceae bacterium]